MKRRIALVAAVLNGVLVAPAIAAPTTAPYFDAVTVTAAPTRGLAVVLTTIHNPTSSPLTIYRVKSTFAPETMLHYDVNMCQKGHQMNLLPMVIVPAHRTITLSTKGVGAMLSPLRRALHVGDHVDIAVVYAVNLKRSTINLHATVVKPPKGLVTKPAKSSVG